MGVDWTKLRGWKYDHNNTYLEVWVTGTEVARFDDITTGLKLINSNGLTIGAGGLTITEGELVISDATASTATSDGSMQTDGGLGVAKKVYIGGSLTIADKFTYAGQLYHAGMDLETKTVNYSLDSDDCGKIMQSATDGFVFTLPSTTIGWNYTIVNTAVAGAAKISVSPAIGDKISGIDFTAQDNKDIINTKDTAKQGDRIRLLGDGNIGWYVVECDGTWEREG